MTEIQVQDYLTEYKDWLEEQKQEGNIKESTIRQRHYAIDELTAWFEYTGRTLDTDDFYGSRDNLKEFFKQTKIHGSKVACIRAYLQYIQRQLPSRDADNLYDIRERIKFSRLTGEKRGQGTSRAQRVEEKLLEGEELAAVYAVADPFEELIVQCMLEMGTRPGELAALTPSDFNWSYKQGDIGATVKITKTYSQGVGVQDSPKTEDSIRTVNLRSETVDKLQQFIEDNDIGDGELIFENYRTV